jgi:hypothetical protein
LNVNDGLITTSQTFTITVSSTGVIVPDVVGMTESAARSEIVSHQLTVGTVTSNYSDTVAAGLVISQNPVSGGTVALNSSVSFEVSLGVAPATGYNAWAVTNGIPQNSEADDSDGDGKINLYEYALGGNPASAGDTGVNPVFAKVGSSFEYRHLALKNDTNVSYAIEVCTNLAGGVWTTASVSTTSAAYNSDYDNVTRTITTTNESTKFIRLKISK